MGKPHTLWVAFARLYERHSDLPNARIIFEKAVQVGARAVVAAAVAPQACRQSGGQGTARQGHHGARTPSLPQPICPAYQPPLLPLPPLPPPPPLQASFKYVDDLATVWCEWAEMELRHKNFKRALELMRRATHRPGRPRSREVRACVQWCCVAWV